MDARRSALISALSGLLFCLLIAHSYLYAENSGPDAAECRPVSMYPSWARIRSFDEKHTKFASKYSLWLYREQGKDLIPEKEGEGFKKLDGIPILFIPGNAGSYRQVRSIAAETSILYYDENINVVDNPNQKNYDFFAGDFNEDFSAFHGRTILDQAWFLNDAVRFILSLYDHTENPPTSLILMGHSMGGIVARLMMTLPNYVPGSVNTILTLSSPHSAPPLTFDGDLLRVYSKIDRFWYDGFHSTSAEPSLAKQRLHNVSVVSLTGGILDNILPADYTTLGYLVPPSNGFTMFTTGIMDVWTPSDHLAIVWCRQLRRSIARWLLAVADVSSPHRTYPLEKTMQLSREIFMSGFEEAREQDFESNKESLKLALDDSEVNKLGPKTLLSFDHNSEDNLKVNVIQTEPDSTLQLLSSEPLTSWEQALDEKRVGASVLLCKKGKSFESYTGLSCVDLYQSANRVPRSSEDVGRLMDSGFDGEKDPFWGLKVKSSILKEYDLVVVRGPSVVRESQFCKISLDSEKKSEIRLESDLSGLLVSRVHIKLPKDRSMSLNLYVPGAWSSILAYKIRFENLETPNQKFAPFIRQWRDEPYETKWHINVKNGVDLPINAHAIAPYTPFDKTRDKNGLNLELWSDIHDKSKGADSDVEVIFSVDLWASMKLLILRYRLAVVAHCLAVALLMFIFQAVKYSETGKFPDQGYGLNCVCQPKTLSLIMALLGSLSLIVKNPVVQRLLDFADPAFFHQRYEINTSLHPDYRLNTLYLGLEENCLWFLGPVFFLMAVGVNALVYVALIQVGSILVYVGRLSRLFPQTVEEKEPPTKRWRKSKVGGTALLIVLVSLYSPYQFAYVTSLAVQVVTVVQLLASRNVRSAFNYNMGVLMLMLWVLPINIPVLIVFVHNLSINWATPFSSHHNILAVAPIVILVQLQSQYSEWVPIPRKIEGFNLYLKTLVGLLAYVVFYCMLFGVRHTYWLHHLFNFTCGLILLGFGEKLA